MWFSVSAENILRYNILFVFVVSHLLYAFDCGWTELFSSNIFVQHSLMVACPSLGKKPPTKKHLHVSQYNAGACALTASSNRIWFLHGRKELRYLWMRRLKWSDVSLLWTHVTSCFLVTSSRHQRRWGVSCIRQGFKNKDVLRKVNDRNYDRANEEINSQSRSMTCSFGQANDIIEHNILRAIARLILLWWWRL